MDYARLRAAALKDGEDEEAVTVDTRALIDKVLARYSGEWTTLRELIQNAADAQATTVKIKWETFPSTQVPLPATTDSSERLKHVLNHHTLQRLIVHNDGQPFTKTDWGRLKRIAEGNPDEAKIGAFGVGFYSVFADCEEPFVSSGDQAMAFYWKGNALFTRKLQLPADQASSDTAFVLEYRNTTTPLPNLLSVSQFLANSLTFVALQNIEFWIDDWQLLSLKKKPSPSVGINIPRDLETRTKEGFMKLTSADQTSVQIDATFMSAVGWKPKPAASVAKPNDSYYSNTHETSSIRSFFSRLTAATTQTAQRSKVAKEEAAVQDVIAENLTATSTSSIFLRVITAQMTTQINATFAAEFERACKKPPAKSPRISILTSSYDETLASEQSMASSGAAKTADVFSTVLPSKKPGGRIYIGFPTTQTTGAGMHVFAPSVVPTVEREAIDLNARWVKTWNIEMLRVTGIVTRLAFINEMSSLHEKLKQMSEGNNNKKGTGISAEVVQKCIPEALHILKTYTFGDSTPSGYVSQIIDEAFWTAYKRASIEVYSSRGVLSTTKVRSSSEELSKFLDGIPVILKDMKDSPFIRKLVDYGLIKDITVDDICEELNAKALDQDQLKHFISWVAKGAISGELDPPSVRRVLDVAVATITTGGNSGDIIALGSIRNYLSSTIPASLPIPPTTLHISFTADLPEAQLHALGWKPLDIVSWLKFLIESGPHKDDQQNLTKSSQFSVQVLAVLSKNWQSLNPSDKSSVVSLLENLTVIPTKMGMRKPAESFFATVKLFDDLPVIVGCNNVKEKFLSALGVRKTVDLETIFARLVNLSPADAAPGSKKWSHVELIKYLTSVQEDIPAADMKKLRESKFCAAECGPRGLEPTKATSALYKVSELFEPKDALRTLQLPILHWPGPPGSYKESSREAQFLRKLGIRQYPSVPELVDMMASTDIDLRKKAMSYFIDNHSINGYATFHIGGATKAFLPVEGNEKKLVTPSACYTNEGAAVLGYNVLRRDLRPHALKFGVATDPNISGCVERLIAKPPSNAAMAVILFEYFTARLNDLRQDNIAKLRAAAIVPVIKKNYWHGTEGKGEATLVYAAPQDCYLGNSSTYGDIFDFVDFGTDANPFLFKCGAKYEPTKSEIANRACDEPAHLLSVLRSSDKYLNLLRSLADDFYNLKKDKVLYKKMRTSPWLLGFREITSTKPDETDDMEDEAPVKVTELAAPKQIVINDDYISYRLFKQSLLCAPEEDKLEAFYQALGSELLGSRVQEDISVGSHAHNQERARYVHKLVLERSKIFLYEYGKHSGDSIRHDHRWLEKNLQVEAVRSIVLRRTLRGHGQSHTEKRSAASTQGHNSWILYVTADGKTDNYQVAQAICQLLLTRPNQSAYHFFEPFLNLDLRALQARGYNVDRILRAKEAEARIAEEERRKALEAEEKRIQERSKEWKQQQEAAKTPEPSQRMPGSFEDSPEEDNSSLTRRGESSQDARRPWKSNNIFQNLTRRFGFDADDNSQKQLDNFLPPTSTPKPPTATASPSPAGTKGKGNDDGRVTSPAVVQQNLLNAIKSTRAHDSSHLFSPPRQNEVKEQTTYCDSTPANDIVFVADAPGGMRVFISKKVSVDTKEFLAANISAIGQFESVLREVGSIYGLSTKALHIFYDEHGGTIAFNSSGSIFCNLRFYNQLHAARIKSAGASGRVEAVTWWWVVIAHELAHNLVQPHNSEHSYYT